MMMSENQRSTSPLWQPFGVLSVKHQKASLKRQPSTYTYGRSSVLTQHQSHDTEMDGQRNTHDGSSGRRGALLEISYFSGELQ